MDALCNILWIVLGTLILWGLFLFGRKELAEWKYGRYSLDDLRSSLAYLLRCGLDGGSMTITFKPLEKSIRFQKYIRSKGDYGIEFSFPGADWSSPYFPVLKDYCVEKGMDFRMVEEEGDGRNPTETFHVDFGKNIERANEFSIHVINDILGIPEDAKFNGSGSGYSKKSQLTDEILEAN